MRKWISFSIYVGQTGHFLSSLGIFLCLPSSIISLWSESRSLVRVTLRFLFLIGYRYVSKWGLGLWVRYSSALLYCSVRVFQSESKISCMAFRNLFFVASNGSILVAELRSFLYLFRNVKMVFLVFCIVSS